MIYASVDLLERAFAELFFFRELYIIALGVEGVDKFWAFNKDSPFVSLPCVQKCEVLRLQYLRRTGLLRQTGEFGEKMLQWLFGGGEKKKLTMEVDWNPLTLMLNTNGHISVSHDTLIFNVCSTFICLEV